MNYLFRVNEHGDDLLPATVSKNIQCPLHVHRRLEMVVTIDGELQMCIKGTQYSICKQEAVLILPFEQHDFVTITHNKCLIIEFDASVVHPLWTLLASNTIVDRKILLSDALMPLLFQITENENMRQNLINTEALLFPLCREFMDKCTFIPSQNQVDDDFLKALNIIHKNVSNDISLESTANQIGIYPETLSRKFVKITGVNFSSYINYLRVRKSMELLRNGASSTEAAYGAGFGSIRSFHRVFLKMAGVTPKKFLESKESPDMLLKI